MKRFVIGAYQMISAYGELAVRTFHMVKGKSGKRWLYSAVDQDVASFVYVEGGPGSIGFGGREIRFALADGGEVLLTGPWHSNADAMFQDTGVDVRGKMFSFCVIAKRRGRITEVRDTAFGPREFTIDTLEDVLYQDEAPVLGTFERPEIKEMAERFADELGHSVYLYKQTHGGSSNGPVDPINPATGKRYPYVAPPEV